MKRQALVLLLLCGTLAGLAGCATMIDSAQTAKRQLVRQFRPSPIDYRDSTEETVDQWADYTREARAVHSAEKDPDPWYRRWFMSEKARQTERHLGIE